MKTVVVLGYTGMLGQMVHRVLRRLPGLDVWGTARNPGEQSQILRFDVAEGVTALELIAKRAGNVHTFVNCIALLKNQIDENDPTSVRQATVVNAFFPHEIALVAKRVGAKVIHVSTDGVFAGSQDQPYLESHPADASDLYGKTKLLGEALHPAVINIRCSLIGTDKFQHRGLIEWFLAQPAGASLSGYSDHIWSGVTTLQFAQLCAKLILGEEFSRLRAESPIHHFTPNISLSKYELLLHLKKIFQKDVSILERCAPEGPMMRVLGTRYKSLLEVFGRNQRIENALEELLAELQEAEPN